MSKKKKTNCVAEEETAGPLPIRLPRREDYLTRCRTEDTTRRRGAVVQPDDCAVPRTRSQWSRFFVRSVATVLPMSRMTGLPQIHTRQSASDLVTLYKQDAQGLVAACPSTLCQNTADVPFLTNAFPLSVSGPQRMCSYTNFQERFKRSFIILNENAAGANMSVLMATSTLCFCLPAAFGGIMWMHHYSIATVTLPLGAAGKLCREIVLITFAAAVVNVSRSTV
ncbi:hypothetical protein NQ318_002500 [Aromia moschata]|uniref:Uncharacterized protein n=1 Tax=Aromia moschata TaxID=1265417 RepID=A0AAV8Y6Y8_9CUCU|nr:hypothetical protein NQ318_002500 [Aromia moschata]